jgi:hypothetical protein
MTGLLYQQQKTGGPHISLVFREMWDTTVLDRQLCRCVIGSEAEGSAVPRTSPGNAEYDTQRNFYFQQ